MKFKNNKLDIRWSNIDSNMHECESQKRKTNLIDRFKNWFFAKDDENV